MNEKYQETAAQIILMSGADPKRCMKCGKCSGACPVYDEMEYHPHQFVSMVKAADLEPLFKSDAIYKCLSCFACSQRCPRDVQPSRIIEAVRLAVIRQQGQNHMTPLDVPPLADGIVPQQAIVSAMRKYNRGN